MIALFSCRTRLEAQLLFHRWGWGPTSFNRQRSRIKNGRANKRAMSDDESRDMTISQNDGGRTKFLGKRFRDLGEGPNGALTAEQAQAARRGESGKAIDFGEGRRTPDERGPPAPPAPPGPPPKGAARRLGQRCTQRGTKTTTLLFSHLMLYVMLLF
jgi:hypothetical protein